VIDQEKPEPSNEPVSPTEPDKTKSLRPYLVNGLIIFGLGFLLWWTVIEPQFKCYGCGTRAYDPDSKANLHNVFLACKAYWADNGSENVCSIDIAAGTSYGYIQTMNVKVLAVGNEKTFKGLAYHIKNNKTWKIDALGTIELLP
jgi:hypothetical protein